MAKDWLRYDRLVEDALRSVVRRALQEVAANGLPGDHHFYLTFHTQEPGVSLSPALRAQYPKEMTIVLQHQFWGLEILDDAFTVTLSFGGKHEKLVIPFQSVISFADPSVKFGLQFESTMEADGAEGEMEELVLEDDQDGSPAAGTNLAKAKDLNDLPKSAETPKEGKTDAKQDTPKTAEVVTLDAFRKK